jgi:hypothetical protein
MSLPRVARLVIPICLAGCGGAQALDGKASAIAAPMPVMLGPMRCIGTCGPEPTAKHPYGKELVSQMASHTVSISESRTSEAITTTTTTLDARAAGTQFAVPLLKPLVKRPLSRRTVVQLEALDLGRSVDTTGGGTDHRTSAVALLAIGIGYFYAVPALPEAAPAAPESESK